MEVGRNGMDFGVEGVHFICADSDKDLPCIFVTFFIQFGKRFVCVRMMLHEDFVKYSMEHYEWRTTGKQYLQYVALNILQLHVQPCKSLKLSYVLGSVKILVNLLILCTYSKYCKHIYCFFVLTVASDAYF